MASKGGKGRSQGTIIIKKNEIVEGGHHGGAWKVAYADFVTAMMAFFLLMWLLNATTQDQRKGLADYFSPSNLMSHNSSGSGQPFGGHTPFDDGEMVSDRGKVDITVGRRPVIDQTEAGEDRVNTDYYHARSGDGVGVGPVKDDQYVDDDPDPKAKGQKGDDNVVGPGGPGVVLQRGQPNPAGATAMGQGAQGVTGQSAQRATGQSTQGMAGQSAQGARGQSAQGATATGQSAQGVAADTVALDKAAEERAAQEKAAENKAAQEKAAFDKAAEQIREAVRADPALADLAKQLTIDMTPDGLRIQILDEVKLPMFASGSANPNERARLLVQKLVPVLNKLQKPISIAGYTDAAPFPGPERTNWELSADRANETRRLLVDGGVPESRIQSVTGHADRDLLLPADPFAAANRRIAIMVLRQAPVPPADLKP